MTGKNRTEKFIMKPPFSKSTLFSEYIEKGTVGAGTKDLENIWLAWAHLPTDRLRHGNQPACNCQLSLTSTPANATSSSLWFCQAGRSRNAISPIKTTTFDLAYGFGSPESPTRQKTNPAHDPNTCHWPSRPQRTMNFLSQLTCQTRFLINSQNSNGFAPGPASWKRKGA